MSVIVDMLQLTQKNSKTWEFTWKNKESSSVKALKILKFDIKNHKTKICWDTMSGDWFVKVISNTDKNHENSPLLEIGLHDNILQ